MCHFSYKYDHIIVTLFRLPVRLDKCKVVKNQWGVLRMYDGINS